MSKIGTSMKTNITRREIIKAAGVSALVPTMSQGVLASTQVQQAIDALVRQGAVILTKTDSSGIKVTEVKLLGKQFDNGAMAQLRLFPDLETLRCIDARVDDAFVKQLDEFPRLRVLGFFNALITDAGLAALATAKIGG